ncbi:MAG: helix-turn-helix domain-containing protein [Caulobacteraceae bacterium]|nr:helix-turn-helix domain-containing protein [Caulobacteraceae bacterium]
MLIAIYTAGLVQAAALMLGLAALKVRRSGARWLLVVLLAAFSWLVAEELADALGFDTGLALGMALEVALGPLLYLFVRALVREDGAPARRDARHFAPLGLALLYLAGLHLGFPGSGISLSHPDMRLWVAGFVFAKMTFFLAYAVATVRLTFAGEAERRETGLPVRILVLVGMAGYLVAAASFTAFFLRLPLPDSDQVSAVVLALSIYGLGYFCLVKRGVFDARPRYEASPMDAGEAADIAARARRSLDLGEAYRDPDYGLGQLAAAIGVSEARLSQALNTAPGVGGFHQLLAQRRVAAFREAAMSDNAAQRTVLDLAFEAGFNSKATFYRAFQAVEGVTPNQFRARLAGRN